MSPVAAPSSTATELDPLLRSAGPRILAGAEDEAAFGAARTGDARGGPVGLRVLACAGRTLWVRPGTPDAEELAGAFRWPAHVPPVELGPTGFEEPAVIVAGCGAGYGVADLCRRLPRARVIGVEPGAALAELARRNTADFTGRCVIERAGVGREDAPAVGPDGVATLSMGTLVARHARNVCPELTSGVDYVFVDLRGVGAGVLAPPSPWLARVGCVRVRCPGGAGAEAVVDELRTAGMTAWVNEWGGPVVTGVSRAFAARIPRFPVPQDEIDPGPGFW